MKIFLGSVVPAVLLLCLCPPSVYGHIVREQPHKEHPSAILCPRENSSNKDRELEYDQVVGDPTSSSGRHRREGEELRQVKLELGQHVLPSRHAVHFQNSGDEEEDSRAKSDFPCPTASDIAPCVCSFDDDFNIDLDCTLVESDERLINVFQQEFPVTELRGFIITGNSTIKILGRIQNGVSFKTIRLDLGNFALEEISDYFLLASKDTLTSLRVVDSQLSSLQFPFSILAAMEKLQSIEIIQSQITWIPKILAPNVTNLIFTYGKTEIIESGSIPINDGRLMLTMEHNNISIIEPEMFYFAGNNGTTGNGGAYVSMEHNRIQSLEPGTFYFPNGPVYLFLLHNEISSVKPGAFVMPQLSGSPSHEEIFINLSFNRFESLEAGTFVFRDGPMTVWLVDVEGLSSIAPGTFVMPPTTDFFSLQLSLYGSELKTFDEEVFGEVMPYVTELVLTAIPLTCGCDIAWIVTNPDYLQLAASATCEDGTPLTELDPVLFETLC